MMAGRGTIKKGVTLLILQAGWNGTDILVDEMVYHRGRVLRLDIALLYRTYPVAIVAIGSIPAPLQIKGELARYAREARIPFVLAADGKRVIGMATDLPDATAYPEFPAPTELLSALGRDSTGEDPRVYPPTKLPEARMALHKALAMARALDAIVDGEKRVLLLMAEGAGRGSVALQIAWKLLGSGRCSQALYLLSGRDMLDYAQRIFAPFGDRVVTLDGGRAVSEDAQMHLAPVDHFLTGGAFDPAGAAEPNVYDLILIPDIERTLGWESVIDHMGDPTIVGFSDKEPPSDEVVGLLGLPVFSHPLEAELAIRAAAGEPEADIFDTFGE